MLHPRACSNSGRPGISKTQGVTIGLYAEALGTSAATPTHQPIPATSSATSSPSLMDPALSAQLQVFSDFVLQALQDLWGSLAQPWSALVGESQGDLDIQEVVITGEQVATTIIPTATPTDTANAPLVTERSGKPAKKQISFAEAISPPPPSRATTTGTSKKSGRAAGTLKKSSTLGATRKSSSAVTTASLNPACSGSTTRGKARPDIMTAAMSRGLKPKHLVTKSLLLQPHRTTSTAIKVSTTAPLVNSTSTTTSSTTTRCATVTSGAAAPTLSTTRPAAAAGTWVQHPLFAVSPLVTHLAGPGRITVRRASAPGTGQAVYTGNTGALGWMNQWYSPPSLNTCAVQAAPLDPQAERLSRTLQAIRGHHHVSVEEGQTISQALAQLAAVQAKLYSNQERGRQLQDQHARITTDLRLHLTTMDAALHHTGGVIQGSLLSAHRKPTQ